MKTNKSVELSRRFYANLLGLYPREFRNEFGPSMLQVFTDQCCSTFRENGSYGMFFLWIRTLIDLAASVVREQIASPSALGGLLEAVPNRPLPWKGVLLVLIPCLVFLAGQIGQLTGQDTFYLLIRRAGYYLMVPVLLVWLWKRKFPVWGLVPLGIFYRTMFDLAYRFPYVSIFSSPFAAIFESPHSAIALVYRAYPKVINLTANLAMFLKKNSPEIHILAVTFLFGTVLFLILRIARRHGFTRPAWIWTGIFLILTSLETISGLLFYWHDIQVLGCEVMCNGDVASNLRSLAESAYYNFTIYTGFLLLILIGVSFAGRHGRLALLLPLGYIIPTVVLGRFDDTSVVPYSIFWISLSVLAYRVLVTLIAPVWIVRSASDRAKRRAGAIAFPAAIGILLLSHFGFFIWMANYYDSSSYGLNLYYTFSPELITLAGIALALVLYRSADPQKSAPAPEPGAVEVSNG
jgi:hypothetical protein